MESISYEADALECVGKRIRYLRTEQGLSQVLLADSLGISARYLGEIEAGKRNPSFGVLYAIAERLATPLPELLSFERPQAREDVIKQINSCLERLPLRQLQFIQRALRLFKSY